MKFDNNPIMDIRPPLGPAPGQSKASPVLFDFPNSRANVFLMMRFQDTDQNREIHKAIKTELAHYGLNLLRADEKNYAEWLWDNVRAYMDACAFGIAVFEQIDEQNFNPNVSLELGYMLANDKPVLLLKQEHLPNMPSDVVGRLYRSFDAFRITTTTQPQVRQWLQDIGVAKFLVNVWLSLSAEVVLVVAPWRKLLSTRRSEGAIFLTGSELSRSHTRLGEQMRPARARGEQSLRPTEPTIYRITG